MSNVGNHNSNPLILSYNGTCCIYQSDLRLLESDSEWLNDSCINFQMTRLSERTVEAATTITTAVAAVTAADGAETASKNDIGTNSQVISSRNNDSNDPIRIVFMDPSIVSFFMHQISIDDDEDRDEILGLYNNTWELNSQDTQSQTKLQSSSQPSGSKMVAIMIPINDNHAGSSWAFQTAGAGNHWSLLFVVIYIEDLVEHNTTTSSSTSIPSPRRRRPNYARYFHFDSCHGCNSSAAKIVATRVERLLSIGVIDSAKRNNSDANASTVIGGSGSMMASESEESRELPKRMKTSVAVVDCVTPQQSNGYDCGLCTLANSEALSVGIDGMPRRHRRREDCENGSGVEGGDGGRNGSTYDDDDKEVKKWLEQTVKSFMIGYGGMGKMAKSIRRKMAADVKEMKESNH
eukprot:CAMPEP_0198252436 /NCGR_PEP_ID=MMETSP1447-20131203/2953_1 /TAXON_ID=420782 /ORGANISM="Chaetoceros dichaeta, Strain CCMP1751" /LENGTH=405 /DNA_ID=CAMNT_0043937697 /DNA_START=24 /DNA_END=1241 /DNA_ORIENTATION=-